LKVEKVECKEDCPYWQMPPRDGSTCDRIGGPAVCRGPDSKDCPLKDLEELQSEELEKMGLIIVPISALDRYIKIEKDTKEYRLEKSRKECGKRVV
jgi:hypothetical protein